MGDEANGQYFDIYQQRKKDLSSYTNDFVAQYSVADFNQQFTDGAKDVQRSLDETKEAVEGTNGAFGTLGSAGGNAIRSIGKSLANAALMAGIGILINLALKGLDLIINADENAIAKAKELRQQWEENNEVLSDRKQIVDDYGERYEELSKGVDTTTNQNLSLSTDEYAEYLDLTNRIASQFPTLISGYDSEGNAILKVQGSLAALNTEYERLAQLNRNQVIVDAPDVITGSYKELNGDDGSLKRKAILEATIAAMTSGEDVKKTLEKQFSSYDLERAFEGTDLTQDLAMRSHGLRGLNSDFNKRISENEDIINQLQSQITLLDSTTDVASNAYEEIANAMFGNQFATGGTLSGISDENKALINQLSGLKDGSFWASFGSDGTKAKQGIQKWVLEQTEALAKPEVQNALDIMRQMRQEYEANEKTYKEMSDSIIEQQRIMDKNGADGYTLARNLLPDDMKTKVAKLDALLSDVEGAEAWNFTADAYDFAMEQSQDTVMTTAEMLDKMAIKAKEAATAVDTLKTSYENFAGAAEAGSDIIKAMDENGFISVEQRDALVGKDGRYRSAFKQNSMTGATELDYGEYKKIQKEIAGEQIAIIDEAAIKLMAEYNEEYAAYNELLASGVKAEDEAAKTQAAALRTKYDEITAMQLLKDGYVAATSALQAWREASNAPEEGDEFREGKGALTDIQEGQNSGRKNTNKYKAAVQYWFGEEGLEYSDKELNDRVKQLNKYYKNDGELNVGKFLEEAKTKGAMETYKGEDSQERYRFDPEKNLAEISDAMGLSKEAITNIIRALNEYTTPGEEFHVTGEDVPTITTPEEPPAEIKTADIETDTVNINAGKVVIDGEGRTPAESVSATGTKAGAVVASASGNSGGSTKTETSNPDGGKTTVDVEANTETFEAEVEEVKTDVEADPVLIKAQVIQGEVSNTPKTTNTETSQTQVPNTVGAMTTKVEFDTTDAEGSLTHLQAAATTPVTKPIGADTSEATKQASVLDARLSKAITKKVNIVTSGPVGYANVDGTGGNSYTGGKGDRAALVGEIAPEIVVNRKSGTWRLVQGPEITPLSPGDIVFNGKQTKDILSGRKTSFGKAMVDGTGGNSYAVGGSITIPSAPSSGGKKTDPFKTTKVPSTNKAVKDLYDWIQRAVEVAKKATEQLIEHVKKQIGYINKNATLDKALEANQTEMETNQAGYERYMQHLADLQKRYGLDADMISRIQNGTIDLNSYTDKVRKQIEDYKKWYDLAQQCLETVDELKEQELELNRQKLDNIDDYYNKKIDRLEARIDKGSANLDRKAAAGEEVTAQDYVDAIAATQEKLLALQEERKAYQLQFDALVESGVLEPDSDEWHEYIGILEGIDETLIEAHTDLSELIDEMEDIPLTNLRNAYERLEAIQSLYEGKQGFHEAQGTDNTPESYAELIKNGFEQIKNLQEQNELLRGQQEGLDVLSEKWQEIQSEIEDNEQSIWDIKTAQEEWNDAILDLSIDRLQKERDELEKVNDELQRAKDMEDALEDLEKAKTQKNKLVFREGLGFVYERDEDAVKQAQDRVDELRHEEMLNKIDEAIDAIEESKETDNIYDYEGANILKDFAGEDFAKLYNLVLKTTDMAEMLADKAYQQSTGQSSDASPTTIELKIEAINLNGVNDVDTLAQSIVNELPNKILQKLYS